MVNLRVFGLFVAILSAYFFYRFYQDRKGKTPIFIGLVFSTLLAFVSVYPDFLNYVFKFLTQTRQQFYRVIILLIISVIVLAILEIRTLFVTNFQERTIIDMVKNNGIRQFKQNYDSDRINEVEIVIPAYNEAKNLKNLLPKIPERIENKNIGVILVSDASNDNTKEIARDHDFVAIENLANVGGGAALTIGFSIARWGGADYVVTMDADGQHDPGELEKLLNPVLDDEADFVVGSRQSGEMRNLSTLRTFGIYFFNGLISLLLGQKVTDCSNGFRAFQTNILDNLSLHERQYHTTEFLIKALSQGIRFKEIPITVLPREHGESKKGPDLLYGLHFFKVLIQTWWRT